MADEKDEVQRQIETSGIRPGDQCRHYKGSEYEIVACAMKKDTLEPLVIYQGLEHGALWARTFENWNEEVEVGGKRVKRFVLINN